MADVTAMSMVAIVRARATEQATTRAGERRLLMSPSG